MHNDTIDTIVQLLSSCNSVLAITGAGLSADSGLPTYRGIGGLYNDLATEDGIPIEKAVSGAMFAERPEITWKYILDIESNCRSAKCNRGHQVLALMEDRFERMWTLTQNVDGFHHQAGSRNLIEIHGDIHTLRCTSCDHWERVADYRHLEPLPTCPECGALIRPDVVLFGELLPERAVNRLRRELATGFDLVFSIGTSSLFPYIAGPVLDAANRGLPTIEINPGKTIVSNAVQIHLPMPAAEALDKIWSRFLAQDVVP